jgi:hypothetical protein
MFAGGCDCKALRYRMTREPMIVHCCHCRWCQRETGASFALNAVVEADAVALECGTTDVVLTPSASGKGQKIHRCPTCRVAIFSHYPGAGDKVAFVRVGTLDEPDRFAPDVHIFTSTKQPWVTLPAGARAFAEFYNPKEVWTPDAAQRWAAVMSR